MDIVILAGGKGSRVKEMNPYLPKPMIKFNGINFLQILINHYSKFDIENIYILAGYKGKIIKKKFHNKIQNFVKIRCFIERKPLDTAGALNNIKKIIKNDFLLINGDTFFDIQNINILKKSTHKNKIGCVALVKSKKKVKLGNLDVSCKNILIHKRSSKYINAGVYYFKKKILSLIKNRKLSMENDLIPYLIKGKLVNGKALNNFFIDIGTPDDLNKAKSLLIKKLRRSAVFLDRDGVINYDKGYTHKFSNFKFRKNVIKFLKRISEHNRYIFLITNQAGIAKKKFSIKKFKILQKSIKSYLSKKNIFINDVEFCPHHPRGILKKYTKKCKCRKPGNLMIKKIEKRWFIDKRKSYFIGDQPKDKMAARKSNLKFYFVKENILKQVYNVNS